MNLNMLAVTSSLKSWLYLNVIVIAFAKIGIQKYFDILNELHHKSVLNLFVLLKKKKKNSFWRYVKLHRSSHLIYAYLLYFSLKNVFLVRGTFWKVVSWCFYEKSFKKKQQQQHCCRRKILDNDNRRKHRTDVLW